MAFDLTGKKALVTGGTRGVGRGIVLALARSGADVITCYRQDGEAVESLTRELKETGGQHHVLRADLTEPARIEELLGECGTRFGRLDVVVNNAAVISHVPYAELSLDEWQRVLSVNLTGVWLCMKHELLQMQRQGGGVIVNTASIAGLIGAPNLSAYGITKAGLRHMATCLGVELGRYGITVNALGIGSTVNERNLENDPLYAERWAGVIPMGRAVQPADLAAALLFLVSPEAEMITGHTLLVEGGWTTLSSAP